MDINLDYYRVFYYVVKYQKISVAAEKLYVSQPAVTQTIKKLEEALGDTLFIRNKKGIELTKSGQSLYEFISNSIDILDNVGERFSKFESLEEGTIRIRSGSHVAKLVLYDAVEKFAKDYPNIHILISTGSPKESEAMVASGELDLMATYFPYEIEYNNLQKIEIRKNEYIFVMSKKYQEENNVKIEKIEDINNYSFISPLRTSATGRMFYKSFGDKITNCHLEIAQEQMKKTFIKRDLGIGFITRDEVKDELESGELVEIKLKETREKGAIGIVTLDKKFMSFATRKFVEYIKKEVEERDN